MIGYNATNRISVIANTTLAAGLRVKWHSVAGEVVVAGDEACIGVTANAALVAGDPVTILDIKSPGTLPFTAGGAIVAGAAFTSAASGLVVTGTGGNEDYGVAITASGGTGQMIEGTSAK